MKKRKEPIKNWVFPEIKVCQYFVPVKSVSFGGTLFDFYADISLLLKILSLWYNERTSKYAR